MAFNLLSKIVKRSHANVRVSSHRIGANKFLSMRHQKRNVITIVPEDPNQRVIGRTIIFKGIGPDDSFSYQYSGKSPLITNLKPIWGAISNITHSIYNTIEEKTEHDGDEKVSDVPVNLTQDELGDNGRVPRYTDNELTLVFGTPGPYTLHKNKGTRGEEKVDFEILDGPTAVIDEKESSYAKPEFIITKDARKKLQTSETTMRLGYKTYTPQGPNKIKDNNLFLTGFVQLVQLEVVSKKNGQIDKGATFNTGGNFCLDIFTKSTGRGYGIDPNESNITTNAKWCETDGQLFRMSDIPGSRLGQATFDEVSYHVWFQTFVVAKPFPLMGGGCLPIPIAAHTWGLKSMAANQPPLGWVASNQCVLYQMTKRQPNEIIYPKYSGPPANSAQQFTKEQAENDGFL